MFAGPGAMAAPLQGMGRGTGPEIVAAHRSRASAITHRTNFWNGPRSKAARPSRKVATDYCSAYLIARWASTPKTQVGHLRRRRNKSRYNTEVFARRMSMPKTVDDLLAEFEKKQRPQDRQLADVITPTWL
jgi:hypothetical protein